MSSTPAYEPRYLAGIMLFNQHEFFEAHEVWESLWLDEGIGDDRRFIQGLIQAAVGLYHFGNGNYRGALKLYRTARAYMERYPSPYLGLDRVDLWSGMERCFASLLAAGDAAVGIPLEATLIPSIHLEPAPEEWPDPAAFLEDEQ